MDDTPVLPEAPEVAVQEPNTRRAAATFIFLTVALDMLAVGMILPVLPRLIGDFTQGNAVKTSQMLGIFGTMFAGIQFFCSPVLGSLSDRYGRRPVVLLSNLGLGLDYFLMAWAPALGWLFAGRIISGLTASSIPTAMAYMTDVTPREKRAAAFGMVNAAFGMGFILGPAVGGVLGNVNPRLPFWVAGVLSLANALYGLMILPESLPLHHRSPFSWKNANPVAALTLFRRHSSMTGLAVMLLIAYITQQSLNIYVIYADYRYHWSERGVGFSLAAVGLIAGFYGIVLIKRVVAKLGERGAILFGLAGGAVGFVMFGSATTGLTFLLGVPVLNLISLVWPSAQSILSHQIGPSEQGRLQGSINGLRGIAGLIGPGLFAYIFSKSIEPNAVFNSPGAPFFLAAAMLLICLIVAQRVTRPGRSD